MKENKERFDRVLNTWDVISLAFGAAIGWSWVVLSGSWLETAGTVDWTRTWSGGNAADFPLFTVAGDAALGTIRFTLTTPLVHETRGPSMGAINKANLFINGAFILAIMVSLAPALS